jgi:signal transduction histidine kinase
MSIGLPVHLAPHSVGRAFMRASHSAAYTCLALSVLTMLMFQAQSPSLILWPAVVSVLPLFFLLWLVGYTRSPVTAVIYIAVGGVAAFLVAFTVYTWLPELTPSHTFLFIGVAVPIMLSSVSGIRPIPAVAWAVAGFIVSEAATTLAAVFSGSQKSFDAPTAVVLFIYVVTIIALSASQQRVRFVSPTMHRAARDERLSDIRLGLEARAAAVLHDTVLNHLAAISSARGGAVAADDAAAIARDLEQLVGQEWLIDSADETDTQDSASWATSRLATVIDEVQRLGLEIEVNGELSAIAHLDPVRGSAVALAARQCLVNVVRHADTASAEVVIIRSAGELAVMIVDSGRGFNPDQTKGDRLGIRESVRSRMEAVGGSARVWSAPGRGTSVVIVVPVAEVAPSAAQRPHGSSEPQVAGAE